MVSANVSCGRVKSPGVYSDESVWRGGLWWWGRDDSRCQDNLSWLGRSSQPAESLHDESGQPPLASNVEMHPVPREDSDVVPSSQFFDISIHEGSVLVDVMRRGQVTAMGQRGDDQGGLGGCEQSNQLDSKLELRRKQFHVLIASIHQLQALLETGEKTADDSLDVFDDEDIDILTRKAESDQMDVS
ncbi:THO complex subunit 7 [Homalodisca vitripennis]|nr:THO complex subunit 7 [Homalodisca vitripennis]KAG8324437.1 THO complex subunit 7 [Homalodisca vitripennis]